MTIGIYRLCFKNTDKCYIGQSTSIELRYKHHLNSFVGGKANPKMMEAYNTYGFPSLEILCECGSEELDTLEAEAVEIYNSVNNGFNIRHSAQESPIYYGEDHPRCRYSNEVLLKAAELLTDTNNKAKDISKITGVSLDVVQAIASLKAHNWIEKENPEIYSKLVLLKGTRKNPKGIAARGIAYPPVQSPDGIIYTNISNLSKFCEEHGLCRPNFRKLLKGKINSSFGWRLVTNG